MNRLYFLKRRTRLARNVFDAARSPFLVIQDQIERGEAPYAGHNFADGEPPFLEEWIEAEEGCQCVSRMCLAMLSTSLKLYFASWERHFGIQWNTQQERDSYFKTGYIDGYRRAFGELLGFSWEECPADLTILEQLVLARNRDQHPESLTNLSVYHKVSELRRFESALFISESERNRLKLYPETIGIEWLAPAVHVTREAFMSAAEAIDELSEWFDAQALGWKRRGARD